MATTLFPLRHVALYEEPDGSFAVDHSATPGDFLAVPAQTGDLAWTPDRTLLDPATLQQYKHGRPTKVHGPRAATLNLTVPLAITGTLADAATATPTKADTALFRQLAITMGGEQSGQQGSLVATATSSSVFTVTTGEGGQFTAGGAVGRVTTGGNMEIREIASMTGGGTNDVMTLKQAFSEATSISDVIYNAATFYLDDSNTHAQYLVEGSDADDYHALLGMQLQGLSLGLGMGEIPTIGFQMQGADWDYLGSGSLSGASYANHTPISFDAGEFMSQVEGTATLRVQSIYEMTMSPALTYIAEKSPEGVQTINRYVQQHAPPVMTGTFGTYYEDQTYFNAWLNRTVHHSALQIGRSSAGGVLITCNGCQLGPVTSPQNAGEGFVGSTVSFEAGLDGDATDQSTALRRSPFRIHFVG